MEEITDKEFEETIKNNKKVIVDVYADWCYPCKILSPILEELSKKYKEIKFVKLNADNNIYTVEKFKIRSIPTLLYFKEGKLVNITVGALPKQYLEEEIEKLL